MWQEMQNTLPLLHFLLALFDDYWFEENYFVQCKEVTKEYHIFDSLAKLEEMFLINCTFFSITAQMRAVGGTADELQEAMVKFEGFFLCSFLSKWRNQDVVLLTAQ